MAHSGKAYFFFFLLFLLSGCGEESIFRGIADDSSPKAKEEQAREALDKGDCATAIRLFTELHEGDKENVDLRLDLSAAYLCQAGFSVQGVFKVAADFGSTETAKKDAAAGSLFVNITKQVSTLIPDTALWQANVCKSKELLGDVKSDPSKTVLGDSKWPCSSATKSDEKTPALFKDDKDAGYILSIVNLADATLSVVDALNTVNGVAQCGTQTVQATQTGTAPACKLTVDDLTSIVNSLVFAELSVTSATGSGGELSKTVSAIVAVSDDDPKDGKLTNEEMLNYFAEQKLITPGLVTTPENCTVTPNTNPPKYSCK